MLEHITRWQHSRGLEQHMLVLVAAAMFTCHANCGLQAARVCAAACCKPLITCPPPNTHTHLVVWCQLLGAQFKHLNHSDADPAPRVLPLT